jgi:hypothetical protein
VVGICFENQDLSVSLWVDFPLSIDDIPCFFKDFLKLSDRHPHLTMNDLGQLHHTQSTRNPEIHNVPVYPRWRQWTTTHRSSTSRPPASSLAVFPAASPPSPAILLPHQFSLTLLQRRNQIVQSRLTHRTLRHTYSPSIPRSRGGRGHCFPWSCLMSLRARLGMRCVWPWSRASLSSLAYRIAFSERWNIGFRR